MLNIITARCFRAIGRGVSRAGTNYIFVELLPPSQVPQSHMNTTPTKVARDPSLFPFTISRCPPMVVYRPSKGSCRLGGHPRHYIACLQPRRIWASTPVTDIDSSAGSYFGLHMAAKDGDGPVTVALWRSRDGMLRFRFLLFISTVPGLASARLDEGAGCWLAGL